MTLAAKLRPVSTNPHIVALRGLALGASLWLPMSSAEAHELFRNSRAHGSPRFADCWFTCRLETQAGVHGVRVWKKPPPAKEPLP